MSTRSDTLLPAPPNTATAGRERDSELIDLGGLWLAFRRRILLFAIVATIIAIAVLAAYFLMKRQYVATAQVAVATQQQNVVANPQVTTSEAPDTYAVDTEVQVVQSRTVARRVVEQLKLYDDPEFAQGAMDSEQDAATRSPNPAAARERAVKAATDALLANLVVSRSGTAFAIDIGYRSPSAATAANVVNMVARQYLQTQLDTKTGATGEATSWLTARLAELRGQVLAAEAAVQRYRAQNGLLNTGSFLGGPNAASETMTQQGMASVNNELSTAQANLAETQARASTARRQLSQGSTGEDVGEALSSPVVTQLRQQRAEVSRNVADLLTRYGPNHPDLLRAQNQLSDIDSQIQNEIRRVISGLDAQTRVAAGRVGSLQGSLSRSQGTLAMNSAAGVKLAEMERNAEAVRTLYQGYLNRYRETSTQSGLERPDARLISLAAVPTTPASPKLALFLPLALLGGLAGGALAVALREMLDKGVHSSREIRELIGLRTLATIPQFASTLTRVERRENRTLNPRFVVDRPFSAFTESFRMLRATLYDHSSGAPYKVVAITSALPGEGKSTSAICLTRVAAIGGERAVLVECDTRRKTRTVTGTETEAGLLEVLAGTATLDQALQLDPDSGAYLLPLSRRQVAPGDVLASPAMDKLLAALRQRFDLVVLDTAPVLPIAETRLLAAKADAVAYLVSWGRVPSEASAAGARSLIESGANVVGAVLTLVDLNQQRLWDSSDASSYYDKYKSYYA